MIIESEAKELWLDNYRDYWHHQKDGYVVGFDMFHTLHCLVRLSNLRDLIKSSSDSN